MPKKINFSAKPTTQIAEDWVNGKRPNPSHSEVSALPDSKPVRGETDAINMKRLTLDIPENLHRRIKTQCAMKNTKMVDEIRLLLEEKFPAI